MGVNGPKKMVMKEVIHRKTMPFVPDSQPVAEGLQCNGS